MGYYIRVLALETRVPPLRELRRHLPTSQELSLADGEESTWSELLLQHKGGNEIAVIERNPVLPGELGEEELNEFIQEAGNGKPESAARWLVQFLPKVRVIYAFQLLSGTEEDKGWDGVDALRNHLWNELGGILQADLEGFSNEQGFQILWQFNRDHSGPWKMAVLNADGEWVAFEMDLGNAKHKESFLRGQVPEGAKLL